MRAIFDRDEIISLSLISLLPSDRGCNAVFNSIETLLGIRALMVFFQAIKEKVRIVVP